MKTATLVKEVQNNSEFHQQVFKMDPPYKGNNYIFISKVDRYEPLLAYEGHLVETYIFPSDEECEPTSYLEMEGSKKGRHSIKEILEGIGYTYQDPSN